MAILEGNLSDSKGGHDFQRFYFLFGLEKALKIFQLQEGKWLWIEKTLKVFLQWEGEMTVVENLIIIYFECMQMWFCASLNNGHVW